jgi:hypothetical protein
MTLIIIRDAFSVDAMLNAEQMKNAELSKQSEAVSAQRSVNDERIRTLSDRNARQSLEIASPREDIRFLMDGRMLQREGKSNMFFASMQMEYPMLTEFLLFIFRQNDAEDEARPLYD